MSMSVRVGVCNIYLEVIFYPKNNSSVCWKPPPRITFVSLPSREQAGKLRMKTGETVLITMVRPAAAEESKVTVE